MCDATAEYLQNDMKSKDDISLSVCLWSVVCQEREAALDAVMGRMREEATEAGLKDGLKKAVQMLDMIRAGFV